MNPRSIGIVLHDFPLGGTERIALRLARAWIARGITVTLFCGEARGPLRDLVPEGAALIEAAPPIARARGSRRRLGRAAARHFTENPVECVFVIGNYHWDIVPALAAMPGGRRPRILVQISSPLTMPQRGKIRQAVFEARMRRLLCGADACVAMDEGGRIEADRILGRAITTALPLPALDDGAPCPCAPCEAPHIVAAGRLIHQKGFDLLIDAVARIAGARLTIVGIGPEQAGLQEQIARTGTADRIRLAGFAPDIRPFLDSARLFVLPSRFEGYGAVIVEALAAGRPVIATCTTPAATDLLGVPGRGRIVPPGDIAALADAIGAQLAAPPPDPAALADAVTGFRLDAGADAYLAVA